MGFCSGVFILSRQAQLFPSRCLAFHRSLHCLPNVTILQRDTLSDNLCEQFDPDQDQSKLFDTLMDFLKDFFFEKLIL